MGPVVDVLADRHPIPGWTFEVLNSIRLIGVLANL